LTGANILFQFFQPRRKKKDGEITITESMVSFLGTSNTHGHLELYNVIMIPSLHLQKSATNVNKPSMRLIVLNSKKPPTKSYG
jgi:hypothetical protein